MKKVELRKSLDLKDCYDFNKLDDAIRDALYEKKNAKKRRIVKTFFVPLTFVIVAMSMNPLLTGVIYSLLGVAFFSCLYYIFSFINNETNLKMGKLFKSSAAVSYDIISNLDYSIINKYPLFRQKIINNKLSKLLETEKAKDGVLELKRINDFKNFKMRLVTKFSFRSLNTHLLYDLFVNDIKLTSDNYMAHLSLNDIDRLSLKSDLVRNLNIKIQEGKCRMDSPDNMILNYERHKLLDLLRLRKCLLRTFNNNKELLEKEDQLLEEKGKLLVLNDRNGFGMFVR